MTSYTVFGLDCVEITVQDFVLKYYELACLDSHRLFILCGDGVGTGCCTEIIFKKVIE